MIDLSKQFCAAEAVIAFILLLQDLETFCKTLEQIVLEKVSEYTYPVCFDFPAGHQKNNFALRCGVVHSLFINQEKVVLEEFILK